MPRIPVRVEPYSSPSRQHRHYKNKRDQVLRALGKAAYINGSHFAIMWVSARGHVETYASEALQSSLDDWFVKGGIAEEAKQLVKNNSAKANSGSSGEAIAIFEDLSDDDVEDDAGNEAGNEVVLDDVFLDSNNSDRSGNKPRRAGKEVKRSPLAPLNTAIANQHFLRSRNSWNNASNDLVAPKSAPLFPSTSSDFPLNNDSQIPQTSTPILAASTRFNTRASLSSLTPTISQNLFTSSSSSSPLHTITLSTEAARTAFLELRFGQLQQSVCKTVAKAWIKIIEPKKQTRCPYNKGESGKPDWWPTGVRHKEPDHLMKPERHSLLLTILRSTKVRVARLQLATAEVVALIKADKVSLLMDVYRVAREEEKIRDKAVENGNKKESEEDKVEMEVKVGVSTLDGWCKEGSEPTMAGRQIARSATPEIVSEKSNSKKRSAASMVKSNSTSATTGTNSVSKRRSIASTTSLSVENRPRALPHTSIFGAAGAGGCTTTLHTNNNMIGLGLIAPQPRSHSFSGAVNRHARINMSNPAPTTNNNNNNNTNTNSACASTDTSPWPNTYSFTEVNGLVTPLTGSATLDPAFSSHVELQSNPSGVPHHHLHHLHHHHHGDDLHHASELEMHNAQFFYTTPQPHHHHHHQQQQQQQQQNPLYSSTHHTSTGDDDTNNTDSNNSMMGLMQFDGNALGLNMGTEGWNFSGLNMDMSSITTAATVGGGGGDLSNASWQTNNNGDGSFSLDTIGGGPRTPSPSQETNLRINLTQTGTMVKTLSQNFIPHLSNHHLNQVQQDQFWLHSQSQIHSHQQNVWQQQQQQQQQQSKTGS